MNSPGAPSRHQPPLPNPPAARTGWPWSVPAEITHAPGDTNLPRITVVTPSYNQGDFLEETIRSVLLQNYPNLEYIVVDGGSTDNSRKILDKYAANISRVILEPDDGQSDAICKALKLATGKFFNWINSDDLLLPGVLLDVGRRFHDSIDLYTCNVFARGESVEPYTMYNRNLSAKGMLRADRYSFSQPGLWFRTAAVHDCGGIDSNFNYGFDWDLLVRYLSQYPRVHYSCTDGAIFRLHPDSKTIRETQKADASENRFRQESLAIRDKLERTLSASLRRSSLLGREREPWNAQLVDFIDAPRRSPLVSSLLIMAKTLRHPRVRLSRRTVGTVARLLSRYVRPKFYRGNLDGAA